MNEFNISIEEQFEKIELNLNEYKERGFIRLGRLSSIFNLDISIILKLITLLGYLGFDPNPNYKIRIDSIFRLFNLLKDIKYTIPPTKHKSTPKFDYLKEFLNARYLGIIPANTDFLRSWAGENNEMYKFFPPNEFSFDSLEHGYIFHSNPSNFNDPFDSSIGLIMANFQDNNDPKIINEVKKLMNKIGTSCFSESHDSILMWSHYAGNHKGFCIKYNSDPLRLIRPTGDYFTETIDQSWSNIASSIWKVEYSDKFRPIDSESSDLYSKIARCVLLKHTSWEYEKELRSIIRIDKDDTIENRKIVFDSQSISAIYF